MIKGVGLGAVMVVSAVIIALLVWGSYALDINDTTTPIDDSGRQISGVPIVIGKYTPKPMPTLRISIAPTSGKPTPTTSTETVTPTVTKSNSPTPTLYIQATNTPVPQSTQVKADCISSTLICPQNTLSSVNTLMVQCDVEAQENEQEYNACKEPLEAQLNACMDDCAASGSLFCLQNCDQTYSPQLQECQDTYDANNDARKEKYTKEFSKYCSVL